MQRFLLFLLAAVLVVPTSVQAEINWSWTITNLSQTMGSTNIATFNATIFNDESSTEPFDLDQSSGPPGGITGVFIFADGGAFFGTYDFTFGLVDLQFFSQFDGVTLEPGQSHDFVFGTATPAAPPVPDGTYSTGNVLLRALFPNGTEETKGGGTLAVSVIDGAAFLVNPAEGRVLTTQFRFDHYNAPALGRPELQ